MLPYTKEAPSESALLLYLANFPIFESIRKLYKTSHTPFSITFAPDEYLERSRKRHSRLMPDQFLARYIPKQVYRLWDSLPIVVYYLTKFGPYLARAVDGPYRSSAERYIKPSG